MPAKTIRVTFPVSLPGGVSPASCLVSCKLSHEDTDLLDGKSIMPNAEEALTDGAGVATLNLWPNDRGAQNTWYSVTAKVASTTGTKTIDLGIFQLVDGPDVYFKDIRSTSVATVPAVDFSASQSAAKAQLWAEEEEDVEVETSKYSALHHAAKAAALLVPATLAAALAGQTIGGALTVNGALAAFGQVTATGGAVSAPTYSFIGDTGTGISRPTSNALNVVTGGAEVARFLPTGVAIGTTSIGGSGGFSTEFTAGGARLYVGHNGSAASGDHYISFERNGVDMGSIRQYSSLGTSYYTNADSGLINAGADSYIQIGGSESVRFKSGGAVLINATSAVGSEKFYVNGASQFSNGALSVTGNGIDVKISYSNLGLFGTTSGLSVT